jgi:hypothetical protein
MLGLVSGWLLGLLGGVRHAFEPDHVGAVSTLVVEQKGARGAVLFALLWGFGHALMLLIVGGLLFFLRREIPPALGEAFELVVCVMLVFLGARALLRARLARHGASPHAKPHGTNPLLVGLVHGLAGSGALTTLVLASFSSIASALTFIVLYGAGAACGMALLAAAAFAPLSRRTLSPRALGGVLALAGAFSIALGLSTGWPILHRLATAPESAGSLSGEGVGEAVGERIGEGVGVLTSQRSR